jgi:hypothetical protein
LLDGKFHKVVAGESSSSILFLPGEILEDLLIANGSCEAELQADKSMVLLMLDSQR